MFFDNQFWEFSLGSGLTLLRFVTNTQIFSVDDKLRMEAFLDSFLSVSVGTTNKNEKMSQF